MHVQVGKTHISVAPEHLHRLFERFYRVDTSRARSDTHHGLGLSIVRAVAIMHRGDVFALSENGINTFGLTFAKQPDPVRTKEPMSERLLSKPADKIVRESSVRLPASESRQRLTTAD